MAMDISEKTYVVVVDEEGRPIITAENNILLCDKATQGLSSIPFTVNIANEFGIAYPLQKPCEQQENEPSTSSAAETPITETNEENSKIWNTENTLYLIDTVQKFDKQFSSGVKKNVWLKVAECCKHLHKTLNAKHCETKWKSLIRTYKNILLSNNTSGQKKRYWEFFDVMHAIMFKKPEITPVATCSSLRGLRVPDPEEKSKQNESKNQINVEENNEIDNSKSEIDEESGKENFESEFSKKRKRKNSEVEKRHRDKMQRLDRFNELFEKMIDKLPEK
ncbi:unnamed protein product [Ceutorhynchus assimilis]|uniref:Myb/SANT-like DNA-binding domain-containing protein n=1 Tax=Ceutorhynchus assimilis TaxID=467358 RepID=A0A9N9MYW6_9CUCU|nr:unnamed protein product [Ceutorhynchus assimilis]